MSDLISRRAAIEALNEYFARIGKLKRRGLTKGEKAISLDTVGTIKTLPSAEPTLYGYDIESLALVARVMVKEGVTPQKAVQILSDVKQVLQMLDNEMRANAYKAIEKYLSVALDA